MPSPCALLKPRIASYSIVEKACCASQHFGSPDFRNGDVRNISALPPRADVGADIVERPLCAITGREQSQQGSPYSTKTANEFCISHSPPFSRPKARYGVICSAFFFAAS